MAEQVVLVELRLDLEDCTELPIEIVHHVDPLQLGGAGHFRDLMQLVRDGLPIAVKCLVIAAQGGEPSLSLATVAQNLGVGAELNRVRQNAAHASDIFAVLVEGKLQRVGLLGEPVDNPAHRFQRLARLDNARRRCLTKPANVRPNVEVVLVKIVEIAGEVLVEVIAPLDHARVRSPAFEVPAFRALLAVDVARFDSAFAADVPLSQLLHVARVVLGGRVMVQEQQRRGRQPQRLKTTCERGGEKFPPLPDIGSRIVSTKTVHHSRFLSRTKSSGSSFGYVRPARGGDL